LAEIGIPGPAGFDELRIDRRQRLGGATRLPAALHDRPDAIDLDAVAGARAALRKAGLLAGRHDLGARTGLLRRLGDRHASQQHGDVAKGGKTSMTHGRTSGLAIACPPIIAAGKCPGCVGHHKLALCDLPVCADRLYDGFACRDGGVVFWKLASRFRRGRKADS
jgi:hypothetical protein